MCSLVVYLQLLNRSPKDSDNTNGNESMYSQDNGKCWKQPFYCLDSLKYVLLFVPS